MSVQSQTRRVTRNFQMQSKEIREMHLSQFQDYPSSNSIDSSSDLFFDASPGEEHRNEQEPCMWCRQLKSRSKLKVYSICSRKSD